MHLAASPLERAQETAAAIAATTGLQVGTDPRLIESTNKFEGKAFGRRRRGAAQPQDLAAPLEPLVKPSWGEPYREVADRMMAAVLDARQTAHGHEALLVSHMLPIWICRLSAEGAPLRARPAPSRVHAVLAHLLPLRGARPGAGLLLRAGG